QAPRPAGICAIALLCGLSKEFTGLHVEYPFVSCAAVAAHQHADRGPAVTMRLVDQRSVTSRDPGVKDQSNVHHNVDEVGILAVKRTEATSPLVESHCQRSAGMDRSFQERIVGKALTDRCFIPPPVGAVIKDEAEVVNLAVVLAVLESSRIRLGKPAPRRF